MRRVILSLVIGYVILALVGRATEAAGLRTCGCDSDCWCKRPGLSLFRWVFPRFHRSAELDARQKRQLDT